MLKENEIMAAKLCAEDFKSKAYDIPRHVKEVISSMKLKSDTEIICELIWNIVCVLSITWALVSIVYIMTNA